MHQDAQPVSAHDQHLVDEFVRLLGREPSRAELDVFRDVVGDRMATRRSRWALRREVARLVAKL